MIEHGIPDHFEQVVESLHLVGTSQCERLVEVIAACRDTGRTVALAGNGGSAATAEHLAGDWGRQDGLRVLDLCSCSPMITALGNDEGFENVFARQIELLLRPGDVLVLLSTSGRSPNLLDAVRAGRRRQVTVVALTGRRFSPLGVLADLELCADVEVPEVAEDVHLSIGHAIVRRLKQLHAADDGAGLERLTPPEPVAAVPSGSVR
jgi:D-sedoheptulose 7-phosphate isomerase